MCFYEFYLTCLIFAAIAGRNGGRNQYPGSVKCGHQGETVCPDNAKCDKTKKPPKCKCNAGFVLKSDKCVATDCVCTAVADPHITTCDGQVIHYMGKCMYTFARPCNGPNNTAGVPDFHIRTRHEILHDNPDVTWVKFVEVEFNDSVVIRLDKALKLLVNDVIRNPPFNTSTPFGIQVDLMPTQKLRLVTDFGLELSFDGKDSVEAKIPKKLKGLMCGLCGNYNGDEDDELKDKNGVDYRKNESHVAHAEVGDSWLVGNFTPSKCKASQNPPYKCRGAAATVHSTSKFCGTITDPNGPFSTCLNEENINGDRAFESCKFDVCAVYEGDPAEAKNAACRHVETFAKSCTDAGVTISKWRTDAECPMTCSRNAKYRSSGPGCQNTCSNPSAAKECTLSQTEGCYCEPGFVLSGKDCVDETTDCGCDESSGGVSNYFENGQTWMNEDCTVQNLCVSRNNVTTTPLQCSDGAECKAENGVWSCYVCSDGCRPAFPAYVECEYGGTLCQSNAICDNTTEPPTCTCNPDFELLFDKCVESPGASIEQVYSSELAARLTQEFNLVTLLAILIICWAGVTLLAGMLRKKRQNTEKIDLQDLQVEALERSTRCDCFREVLKLHGAEVSDSSYDGDEAFLVAETQNSNMRESKAEHSEAKGHSKRHVFRKQRQNTEVIKLPDIEVQTLRRNTRRDCIREILRLRGIDMPVSSDSFGEVLRNQGTEVSGSSGDVSEPSSMMETMSDISDTTSVLTHMSGTTSVPTLSESHTSIPATTTRSRAFSFDDDRDSLGKIKKYKLKKEHRNLLNPAEEIDEGRYSLWGGKKKGLAKPTVDQQNTEIVEEIVAKGATREVEWRDWVDHKYMVQDYLPTYTKIVMPEKDPDIPKL